MSESFQKCLLCRVSRCNICLERLALLDASGLLVRDGSMIGMASATPELAWARGCGRLSASCADMYEMERW